MQRNFIKEAYKKFSSSDDIIIISDLDEIPSKDKISFIKSCDFKVIAPVAFEQALFHLNCNYLDLEQWIGSVVATKKLIDKYEPQIFRDLTKIEYLVLLMQDGAFLLLEELKELEKKSSLFVMKNIIKKNIRMKTHLKKCIETGSDLFDRKVKKKK